MTRVLFVPGDPSGVEERAALDWLSSQHGLSVECAGVSALRDVGASGCDVVWVHASDELPDAAAQMGAPLAAWVERGGGVLLTLLATPLAIALGVETTPPGRRGTYEWRHADDPLWLDGFRDWPDFPHVRGMQGWGEHPLFDGFVRGAYTWRATEGERVAEAVYVAPYWPAGQVIGVERAYVHLAAETAVAWESSLGAGRIVSIGAHVLFGATDETHAPHRDLLVRNAIRRASDVPSRREVRHWPRRDETSMASPSASARDVPARSLGEPFASPAPSSLAIRSAARDDDAFVLSGRRAFVVGGERAGVREIWAHPLCIASSLDLWIDGEAASVESVEVRPSRVTRVLRGGGATLTETIAIPSDEFPGACIEYERLAGDARPSVQVRATMRLRAQWPVPSDGLAPLRATARASDGVGGLLVMGRDHRSAAHVNVEGDAQWTLESLDGDTAVRATVTGSAERPLRLTFTGGDRSRSDSGIALASVSVHGIAWALRARESAGESAMNATLRVQSPDAEFDRAVSWATMRMTRSVATVPGLGTGLLAGFAATRPGWNDARPGYAWFFGRDACWTLFALLAAGRFDEAREAIGFLVATRDITGKIAHEVTLSGAAHYDAADSTPLFLRAVSAYAAWTGRLDDVRAWWPAVHEALEFVAACDRDGDGLPENTGVGHGWIESGALGGGHVTSYVSSIWIDALAHLAPLARLLDDAALAHRATNLEQRARRGWSDALVDAATGRAALQRMRDGRLVADRTALAAVPILLGVEQGSVARDTMEAIAADAFSAPWGVRMLARDDPRYDPRGYHSGAVWPLYTGWASLAEYRCGLDDAAWMHLRANARLAFERAKGSFDEVLHGDERRAAGVCPDQAWSAAMVVLPFVRGMLGARADASRGVLHLSPRWPASWSHATIEGLRVGDATVTIRMQRGDDGEPRHDIVVAPPGALDVLLDDALVGAR